MDDERTIRSVSQTCYLRNRNFLYLHLRVTPLRFSRSVFTSVAANHASIYSLIRRLINKVEPVEYRTFGRFADERQSPEREIPSGNNNRRRSAAGDVTSLDDNGERISRTMFVHVVRRSSVMLRARGKQTRENAREKETRSLLADGENRSVSDFRQLSKTRDKA